MTPEQLHDAISLLPADLVSEADKKRSAPRTAIRWQRYAAMAASLALMLCSGLWCMHILSSGGAKEATTVMEAAEAPAAMQAKGEANEALPEAQAAPEEAAGENTAADTFPEDSASAVSGGSESGTACFAAAPTVTVSAGGEAYTLTEPELSTVANILSGLTYLPENVCECIAEITVTVNGESRFHINLEEGFVRCDQGQADLPEEFTETLQQILDNLAGGS